MSTSTMIAHDYDDQNDEQDLGIAEGLNTLAGAEQLVREATAHRNSLGAAEVEQKVEQLWANHGRSTSRDPNVL